ncbi:hypothetical protein L1987_22605 [Smallanthus sonchifolius]|uniref:Uncharacterized protein n=1 Tax=Smallanthus sonchifolius TaxID=185202 RepID=A0ACB9IFX8_9ASTR|nr:hypothetical protein L1987_22605 [Smallanthus sonchifolius]
MQIMTSFKDITKASRWINVMIFKLAFDDEMDLLKPPTSLPSLVPECYKVLDTGGVPSEARHRVTPGRETTVLYVLFLVEHRGVPSEAQPLLGCISFVFSARMGHGGVPSEARPMLCLLSCPISSFFRSFAHSKLSIP